MHVGKVHIKRDKFDLKLSSNCVGTAWLYDYSKKDNNVVELLMGKPRKQCHVKKMFKRKWNLEMRLVNYEEDKRKLIKRRNP